MIVTRAACSVSTSASSRAESPPPMTQTSCPAKKWPSQDAQCDTPRPRNTSSPGTPSDRSAEPAATMTARAFSGSDCAVDDTPVALDGDAFDGVEHEFRAGRFGLFMQQRAKLGAGDTPCGKPGKFSMRSAAAIWPPTPMRSTTATDSPQRAACMAAVSPATPAPITTRSSSRIANGSGPMCASACVHYTVAATILQDFAGAGDERMKTRMTGELSRLHRRRGIRGCRRHACTGG